MLKEEDVAVSNVRIDLTRGMHNPLERYLIDLNKFMLQSAISFLFFPFYFILFCF